MSKTTTIRYLLITAVFNTLVAFTINYLVLKKDSVLDVLVVSQFVGLSIWMCVAGAIKYVANSSVVQTSILIFVALLCGVIVGATLSYLYLYLRNEADVDHFFSRVFSYVFIFGLVFGLPVIYFLVSWHQIRESEKRVEQEKIKRLTLEKQSAMTTLKLLQAQIEPHFLFNTLSNISALINTDGNKARLMLENLNEFLRISLTRTRQDMTTLEEELLLVRRYLEIFQIRLGGRLRFSILNNTGLIDVPFPPLVIQPLVENSIRYGIEPQVNGGEVTIECTITDDLLEVRIIDTGLSLETDGNKAGVGIDNVTRRLDAIYGQQASLTLLANKPVGVVAKVKVPL
ncbi:MAG: histidine kinase [Deltaproteobacteria bacterium]|nr:histidine kinase [Deltaproteobacteria bacterium]